MTAGSRVPGARRVHTLTLLALLWGAFVLYGTTIPFDFSTDAGTVAQGWRELKLSAYRLLHLKRPPWSDVVSNLALFAPWSAFLAARARLSGRGLAAAAALAIGSAIVFSAGVELLQIYARSRYASVSDVFLNAAGAVAGFVVGWAGPSLYRRVAPTIAVAAARRPLTALSAVTAGLVWFSSLAPYDVSLDVGTLRQAVRPARVIPFGPTIGRETIFDDPLAWGSEAAAAVLLGGLFSLALREWGWKGWGRALGAAAAACTLSIAIEAFQLFVVGRRSDLSSTVMYLSGALAGAGIVALDPGRQPSRWALPALWAWGVSALLEAMAPLSFGLPSQTELHRALWIPFLGYFRRMDLNAISDLMLQVLTFVPMGALLAVLYPALRLRHAAVAGFLAAASLEALQLFNPHRTTDSTDALLAALGAAGGLLLWVAGSNRAMRAASMVGPPPTDRTAQGTPGETHFPGTGSTRPG